MKKPFVYSLLTLALLLSSVLLYAQELNCKVEVMADKIQNLDPKVFQSLKKGLAEFLNSRKWTGDNFKPNERIDCNFLLTLESVTGDNVFKASLNVQSSRPVYNSSYSTSIVNFIDREITFKYVETQVLTFDENRVSGNVPLESNLTAVFAYYVYVILGMDYNSFAPDGGKDYIKRAQSIVNNAPDDKLIAGWKATDGSRNRYWLTDQMMSPRFKDFWNYFYQYHRKGLDMMSQKPDEARQAILEGIPTLTRINDENPSSIFFQFFFNAKTNEFVNILTQAPPAERKDFIAQLSKMDVPGSVKYRNIK